MATVVVYSLEALMSPTVHRDGKPVKNSIDANRAAFPFGFPSPFGFRFELGFANRNRVQDQFNLERQLEKYETIYESLNDRTGQVGPTVVDSCRE